MPHSPQSRSATCHPTSVGTSSTSRTLPRDPQTWSTTATSGSSSCSSGLATRREIYEGHPFLVKDVLFSAILIAANEALLEIARVVEAPTQDLEVIETWIERG